MSHFAWAIRVVVIVFGAVGLVTALFFYERLSDANPRVAPQRTLVMLFAGVTIYGAAAFAPLPWFYLLEIVGLALLLPWILATIRSRA